MRVLIAPMAAMAETSGPFSRSRTLALALRSAGHEVALCAAQDVNYKEIEGIKNYFAPIPMIMGLPSPISKIILRIGSTIDVQQKKTVHSFEEVLFIAGAISKRQFPRDVVAIQKAIRDYRPDIVYAEFRPAAIVAAKLEKVKVATGFSYPVQKSYASSPQYASNVRKFLVSVGLPDVESVLDIFDWADMKIVPSSSTLEPIGGENVYFTGPFDGMKAASVDRSQKYKNIIVYMGTGCVSYHHQLSVMTDTFANSDYNVYIASMAAKPMKTQNIIVDKRFDFSKLMPSAAAFINHGGQNSIMTGLMYGVPQLIIPGKIFERKYNAECAEKAGVGRILDVSEFTPLKIRSALTEFCNSAEFSVKAEKLGEDLKNLGGVQSVVNILEKLYEGDIN
ncbi:MAG: glycosyltransferase [Bacillota bacterium]|nr:glycosyltransferase [Bacillota bacterium]